MNESKFQNGPRLIACARSSFSLGTRCVGDHYNRGPRLQQGVGQPVGEWVIPTVPLDGTLHNAGSVNRQRQQPRPIYMLAHIMRYSQYYSSQITGSFEYESWVRYHIAN